MVTRTGKFSNPYGYSRPAGKRAAQRLVAEELDLEPSYRLPRANGALEQPNSHLALQLEPRAVPRVGIDLRAVTRQGAAADRAPPGPTLEQLLWRFSRQFGRRLLQFSQRLGQRLLRWVSWR